MPVPRLAVTLTLDPYNLIRSSVGASEALSFIKIVQTFIRYLVKIIYRRTPFTRMCGRANAADGQPENTMTSLTPANLLTVTVYCMPNCPLYFIFYLLFIVCRPILSAHVNQAAHVS